MRELPSPKLQVRVCAGFRKESSGYLSILYGDHDSEHANPAVLRRAGFPRRDGPGSAIVHGAATAENLARQESLAQQESLARLDTLSTKVIYVYPDALGWGSLGAVATGLVLGSWYSLDLGRTHLIFGLSG